ncbi:MAG: ATP-binding protein [Bifidobacteriaceae bacterium]|jgi:hypothetical protein|nr:ATP-binding protein [Bifidobacteriaceae bacterium]
MTTSWDPLTAALGLDERLLDIGVVELAVKAHLEEQSDIEWKEKLPTRDYRGALEFAKDVAAMANSQGGLIVYGIRQEANDSQGKAEAIAPVSLAEPELQRLRSLADSRARPRIPGLELFPLGFPPEAPESGDDGLMGVLALWVPPSADAPHAVERSGSDGALGFPRRRGSVTLRLAEHEVERAYQDRFAQRIDEAARQRDLLADLSERLDLDAAGWIVALSTPRLLPRPWAAPLARAAAVELMQEASAISRRIAPRTGHDSRFFLIDDLGDAMWNPRIGLRRWISQTRSRDDPDERANWVHVEVHNDGAVCLAAATEGWHKETLPDKHVLPPGLVESVALDFISLAATTMRRVGATSSAGLRVQLVAGDGRAWAALDHYRTGALVSGAPGQPAWSRTVRNPLPAQGGLPANAGDDLIRAVARSAALDIANQFGIEELASLVGKALCVGGRTYSVQAACRLIHHEGRRIHVEHSVRFGRFTVGWRHGLHPSHRRPTLHRDGAAASRRGPGRVRDRVPRRAPV